MIKTVLVIGSSKGIGLGLVQKYISMGDKVIATCRNPTEELQKATPHIISSIDLLRKDSPKKIAQYLKENNYNSFDIVIYNAGLLGRE